MKKTVSYHTLGCKLNFSETSTIARILEKDGYVTVDLESGSDLCIINTCSVTNNADIECKQLIKKVLKANTNCFIVITGCYAQLKPFEIANIEGVDLVLGAKDKFNLLNYLQHISKKEHAEVHHCDIENINSFEASYSINDRTRSFLKVQDGCSYSCTFCTIPLARGASRSNSLKNILENVKTITLNNVKEIVLTGINLGDYKYVETLNETTKTYKFLDLLQSLDQTTEIMRYRISSIEPNLLSDEIIDFVSKSDRIAPHFHIPLQSGNNEILGKMKRRYQRELFKDKVDQIKNKMPHACIGVDVLIGFPGETEHHFLDTYEFISKLDISYLHVFTYSERENTDAIHYPNAVPIVERKKRNKMLRILSAKKQYAFYQSQLNKNYKVLVENHHNSSSVFGFTENYLKVELPYNALLINKTVNVKIVSINQNGHLCAEIVD